MRQPQRKDLRASIKPHLSSRLLADTLPCPIHPVPPQQRPRILGHNFSRVRVPDIWRPPSLHKLPSTHQLQPTNLRNILPPHQINSRASPAGHLGISKS